MSKLSGGLFQMQDNEQQNNEANKFHRLENIYMKRYAKTKHNPKHYIQHKFLQAITDSYIELVQTKKDKSYIKTKKDKLIEFLFGKAYDILIRHMLTSKQYINENSETKSDYYNYAMYRINNYTINTYDKEKQTAFVYFTQTIKNAFAFEFKERLKDQVLKRNKMKKEGLEGFITNIDEKCINEMEQDYDVNNYNTKKESINNFITDLNTRYKTKSIRVIEDDNAPRFNRKYTTYDYLIEVKTDLDETKGLIVEYIDLSLMNENLGLYKNYFQKRCKLARETGYQYLAFYSDIYLDSNIDDTQAIWNRIDRVIESIKINEVTMNKNKYDPMLEYIDTELFSMLEFSTPNWFTVSYFYKDYIVDENDEKQYIEDVNEVKDKQVFKEKMYLKRGLALQQQPEYWLELKTENKDLTRVFDCGMLHNI